MLMCSTYGENPRLLPEKLMKDYKRPDKTIPRSPGIHEEWIAAIKAGQEVDDRLRRIRRPLTEVMLLGNIALRMSGAQDRPRMGPGQDGVPQPARGQQVRPHGLPARLVAVTSGGVAR